MLVTDILLSVRSLKILTRGFWAVVLINLAHSQRKNFESSAGVQHYWADLKSDSNSVTCHHSLHQSGDANSHSQ